MCLGLLKCQDTVTHACELSKYRRSDFHANQRCDLFRHKNWVFYLRPHSHRLEVNRRRSPLKHSCMWDRALSLGSRTSGCCITKAKKGNKYKESSPNIPKRSYLCTDSMISQTKISDRKRVHDNSSEKRSLQQVFFIFYRANQDSNCPFWGETTVLYFTKKYPEHLELKYSINKWLCLPIKWMV